MVIHPFFTFPKFQRLSSRSHWTIHRIRGDGTLQRAFYTTWHFAWLQQGAALTFFSQLS